MDAAETQGERKLRITRDALDFILHASKSTHPDEFAGLLRNNDEGVVYEVLVIPQTVYGGSFSSINLHNVGYTSRHSGSVHSHPGRSALPSRADLAFFRVTGDTHIIAAYPFTEDSVRAYDGKGNRLLIEVV